MHKQSHEADAVRHARRIGSVAAVATALIVGFAAVPAQAQRIEPGVNAPSTFADVVERVKPSVVSINVTSGSRPASRNDDDNNNGRRGRGGGSPFPDLPDDHPLNEFFKNFRGPDGRNGRPRLRPRASQGSGFVISEDGYVVTNNHVVNNADDIRVTFDKDESYPAELVGTDPRTDLALLKINAESKTFQPVTFADDVGRVGDWVVAVGNPFGLGGTVTVGVLSALARDIGSGPYDFIQIDAAVNRGNSGGPTFNLKGEVIGVNTAIYSPSGGNVGIAFAVPASTAQGVIKELRENGKVRRGWLGVRIQNVDDDIAASLGLDDASGALVNDVTSGGPAQAAGLQAGDAIISVNGDTIDDSRDLARKIAAFSPDTTVDVKVRRAARDVVIPVKLGTFPTNPNTPAVSPRPEKPAEPEVTVLGELGLTLKSLEEPRGDVDQGVVIEELDSDGDAARKGLQAGDIILQVNSQPVSSVEDVRAAVNKAKELKRPAVLLRVQTSAGARLVAVQFKK